MAALAARTRTFLLTPAKGWTRFSSLFFVIVLLIAVAFAGYPLWLRVLVAIGAVAMTPSLILGFRDARRSRS